RDYRCLHFLRSPHLKQLQELLSHPESTSRRTSSSSCIMHDVGIIVAYTFCEALPSSSYKSFHIFYRISRTSYGRSLFSHALCMMSGLSLPRLFFAKLSPCPFMHYA